jgi:hypothetical protein
VVVAEEVKNEAQDNSSEDEEIKRIEEPTKEELKEPEVEDQQDHSPVQLLKRLFTFVQSNETPLNPVLAGYFSKLVTLLLTRRQK